MYWYGNWYGIAVVASSSATACADYDVSSLALALTFSAGLYAANQTR